MDKEIEILRGHLQTLHAIELLEYHDKNFLSGDNKGRSEGKQALILLALKQTNLIEDKG